MVKAGTAAGKDSAIEEDRLNTLDLFLITASVAVSIASVVYVATTIHRALMREEMRLRWIKRLLDAA